MSGEAEREALLGELAEARALVAESRALLATTLDGFVVADQDGQIVDVNPAYCELLGYAKEELLGMNLRQVEAPLTPEEVSRRIERMRRDSRARFETRHRRKDGSFVDLDVSVCVSGTAERPLVAAFVRDMTQHRAMMAEMENSRLLLEKAQQLANLGIWRWDVAANRVTWSPELYRIYGLDAETFGASFEGYLERVHPGDRERVQATVQRALETRESFQFEERIVRSTGEVRHLRSCGGVVLDDQGQPVQLFGACLDISEQTRIREQLEQRVAARTAELADAKERAEAADRIKSAFLASVSHELRTPLNSIIGFTGVLLQGMVGDLNDEQSKQLSMVRGSARHLLDLINDVLDISKIEAGELELDAAVFDVGEVVERAVAMMAPLAANKNLELQSKVDPAIGELVGDSRRLGQVLLNLLSNAVKFTERGHVRIEAEAQAERVRFRVEDTGIGVAEKDIPSLFLPFRQVDSGLARSHEGTGLGLAISQRLVTMMGGTIIVRSEPGAGSVFEVAVPRR